MILLLANETEPNMPTIIRLLDHFGEDWIRINGESLPVNGSFEIELPSNGTPQIYYENSIDKLSLKDIKSVWNRRRGAFKFSEKLDKKFIDFVESETLNVYQGLNQLLPDAKWMNPYWSDRHADNPLVQLSEAANCGLSIPHTIITQSKDKAKAFWELKKGQVITKSISNQALSSFNIDGFLPTVSVEDLECISKVKESPTLLQEKVKKKTELRVVVVGTKIFAAAIDPTFVKSLPVDVREKDMTSYPYTNYALPSYLEKSILKFTSKLGLSYCSMDIIKSIENEYFFIDLNPGGQWAWIENLTGANISLSIANWLSGRDDV